MKGIPTQLGHIALRVRDPFQDPDGNEIEAIWEPSEQEMERLKEAGLPRLKGEE
jgi:hypothetical protein